MDRLFLIKQLTELVEAEKKYTDWYFQREEQAEKSERQWEKYEFWKNNRQPSNATINDALKLISRLSRDEVRSKKSWFKEGGF